MVKCTEVEPGTSHICSGDDELIRAQAPEQCCAAGMHACRICNNSWITFDDEADAIKPWR